MNNSEQKNIAAPKENLTKEEYQSSSLRDISIWIDGYDDIFSDFDPRAYSERNISDDFLYEIKRVSRESDFHVNELLLLAPEKSRKTDIENIIVRRLHNYFRKNYNYSHQRMKEEQKKGVFLVIIGSIMLILATYILSLNPQKLYLHAFFVILEPAGWFMCWTGLEKLFSTSRIRNPELDFYTKMSKSKIVFINIEKPTDKDHI